MPLYDGIREEELKNKVATDWFSRFDCTEIIGRIDFAVQVKRPDSLPFGDEYLLWAEAKQAPTDTYRMLAQLLVTVKADASDKVPPKFLGCFDPEKIVFVEYHHVLPLFALNDFDWTQPPSAVDEKTVAAVRAAIPASALVTFSFDHDAREIKDFIKANFVLAPGDGLFATRIDKNNFLFVYQKWRALVLPWINADLALLKKSYGVYDRDFFLAEMNIDDAGTATPLDDKVVDKTFYVSFNAASAVPYRINRRDPNGLGIAYEFGFRADGLARYTDFWKRYKRPPQKDYWDYIVNRLDLLVPQDVRERKGSFFTPQICVEKSQEALAAALGENWQEDYVVWDCAAGTGNLLAGLTNKYNVWASTLDQSDVAVMRDRIKNGANLLASHVFQFDFLNDGFEKLPEGLRAIVNDPEKRKKLVIYINPPYAEAGNARQLSGHGENKTGVAVNTEVYRKYQTAIGIAGRELFAQFMVRIDSELRGVTMGTFSKLKNLLGPNFQLFRQVFQPRLLRLILFPADIFDNVKGQFPIGFSIWKTDDRQLFSSIDAVVCDPEGNPVGTKVVASYDGRKTLTDWMIATRRRPGEKVIGFNYSAANDVQHNNYNRFETTKEQLPSPRGSFVTTKNLIESCIYYAVRHVIDATWLNDRDQFLYPNDGWKADLEFQGDCLVYTLFNNNIQSAHGVNHWIPFTEAEVGAKDCFASHFMSDFLRDFQAGKVRVGAEREGELALGEGRPLLPSLCGLQPVENPLSPTNHESPTTNHVFPSPEAKAVLDAGRALWRYYHTRADANPNASYYDIRAAFQGRNEKGKMNAASEDARYTELLANLRAAQKRLAARIAPKVYEYGFLLK